MIEIKELYFSYGKEKVLDGVSFRAEAGDCVGILGNNGAGKSTLITCINRIRTPQSGSIHLNGIPVSTMSRVDLARNVAYVAQKNEMSHTSVFDCVLLGRKPYIKWGISDEDLAICNHVITQIGLHGMELRNLDELSGGEQQKVMLARALVQEPKVLLLDEPTSNLDPRNQYEMLALVRKAAKEQGITVLIVIHDLNLALRYCDRFLFLKDGKDFLYGGLDSVTKEIVETVYGVHAEIVTIKERKMVVIE